MIANTYRLKPIAYHLSPITYLLTTYFGITYFDNSHVLDSNNLANTNFQNKDYVLYQKFLHRIIIGSKSIQKSFKLIINIAVLHKSCTFLQQSPGPGCSSLPVFLLDFLLVLF
jgi:hypothetical protein